MIDVNMEIQVVDGGERVGKGKFDRGMKLVDAVLDIEEIGKGAEKDKEDVINVSFVVEDEVVERDDAVVDGSEKDVSIWGSHPASHSCA